MRAAELRSGHGLVIVERPEPTAAAGEVLVRAAAVGICGSDLEMLHGTRPAGFFVDPVVPGHEWSGVVAAVGADVDDALIGRPVVCEGLVWCGDCRACRAGETNLCVRGYDEIGFTRDGGLAEYVALPARLVHSLPADIALDVATLLEPAAVVSHALARTPVAPGAAVAVIGDGTLGLIAVQLAAAAGAAQIDLFGTSPWRLELAATLGATGVHQVARPTAEALAATYRSNGDIPGADLVVETAGAVSAVNLALALGRRGAVLSLLGIAGQDRRLSLPSDSFVLQHLSVIGTAGAVPSSWDAAIGSLSAGLDLDVLVTHRFPLSEADAAFRWADARREGTLKVLVEHASPTGLAT